MTIRIIRHNSDEYEQMIQLRSEVLLIPIGVPLSYINREGEKTDFLLGAFDKEMIGCCVLTPKEGHTLQLRQMAVKRNLHHTGIGTAIIQFAEKFAKEKEYKKIVMHARNGVIPFYKKCGYEVYGALFTEVGIAHQTMMKTLHGDAEADKY